MQSMTILYADDDVDDRDLMFEAFNQIDPSISCWVANDGKEALEILDQNNRLPDLIFLDVNMPVMDGKSCLQALKRNSRLKDIPVVIYSTTKDSQEISQFYNLGASSFIHKPDNFNDLCTTLNSFIKFVQVNQLVQYVGKKKGYENFSQPFFISALLMSSYL